MSAPADTDTPTRPRRGRRIARAIGVTVLAVYALIGLGGGTAQAAPWDNALQDVTAFTANICGPQDVPSPQTYAGSDNGWGLNTSPPADGVRGTVAPGPISPATSNGDLRIGLAKAYNDDSRVANPSYQRYGLAVMTWDTYGGGCFTASRYFTPVLNGLYVAFVHVPVGAVMVATKTVTDPAIARFFADVAQPFIGAFAGLLTPWIYWVAGFGAVWAFVKHRGSLTKTIAQGAWVFGIVGTFLWISTPGTTQPLTATATNLVTTFSAEAAKALGTSGGVGGSCATIPNDAPSYTAIHEAVWYGIIFQTWAMGEVGPAQAAADAGGCGSVGLSDALLNGRYIGEDSAGASVVTAVKTWNAGSYSPDSAPGEDGKPPSKVYQWSDSQQPALEGSAPTNVPFLAAIKAACNGGWGYGGECDTGPVGTEGVMSALSGEDYSTRAVAVFAGAFGALCVLIALGGVSGYVIVKKAEWFLLLLFGPAFLTIAVFGDDKRRQFAYKYFEALAANLVKTVLGVFTLVFLNRAVGVGLSPDVGVPIMLRPTLILLLLIGMLMLSLSLKRIVAAGVKGDSDIVRRTAQKATVGHAAKATAKTTAKVAATAAAAYATGGGSLASGLAGAAKTGGLAGLGSAAKGALKSNPAAVKSVARMVGTGTTLGSGLMAGARLGQAATQMSRGMARASADAGKALGAGMTGAAATVAAVGTTGTNDTSSSLQAARERVAAITTDRPTFGGPLPAGIEGAVTEGTDILAAKGITKADAARAPETVVPALYGGQVAAMSPLSPATRPLTALAMAQAVGDTTLAAEASHVASQVIEAHGVPAAITAPLHATGEVAAAYQPAHVTSVLGSVTGDMGVFERADAATDLRVLTAAMPMDAPGRAEVEAFTTMLTDPAVSVGDTLAARDAAMAAVAYTQVEPPTVTPVTPVTTAPSVEARVETRVEGGGTQHPDVPAKVIATAPPVSYKVAGSEGVEARETPSPATQSDMSYKVAESAPTDDTPLITRPDTDDTPQAYTPRRRRRRSIFDTDAPDPEDTPTDRRARPRRRLFGD